MPIPVLPILMLAGSSIATATALQARGLRSDDLEPRLMGVPLIGTAIGAGVALALLAGGTVLPVVGAGVAVGAVQSNFSLGQVAHNTDPAVLRGRSGAVPAWLVRAQLIPLT